MPAKPTAKTRRGTAARARANPNLPLDLFAGGRYGQLDGSTTTRKGAGDRNTLPEPYVVPADALLRQEPGPNGGGRALMLTSSGLALLERLAAASYSMAGIAKALSISAPALIAIRKRQPEAEAAWAHGHAMAEYRLVDGLTRASQKGSAVAAMFLLKTRHGYRETGPADGSSAPAVAVQINLPAAMSEDDYRKAVTVVSNPAADASD